MLFDYLYFTTYNIDIVPFLDNSPLSHIWHPTIMKVCSIVNAHPHVSIVTLIISYVFDSHPHTPCLEIKSHNEY